MEDASPNDPTHLVFDPGRQNATDGVQERGALWNDASLSRRCKD